MNINDTQYFIYLLLQINHKIGTSYLFLTVFIKIHYI